MMRKTRLKEVRYIAQGHTARKWQNWTLHTGSPEPIHLTISSPIVQLLDSVSNHRWGNRPRGVRGFIWDQGQEFHWLLVQSYLYREWHWVSPESPLRCYLWMSHDAFSDSGRVDQRKQCSMSNKPGLTSAVDQPYNGRQVMPSEPSFSTWKK